METRHNIKHALADILAVLFAALLGLLVACGAVYGGTNQHSPFPPQMKLYKDRELLQRAGDGKGKETWHFYSPDDKDWYHNTYYNKDLRWPKEDITTADRVLHVRIGHRDRPDVFFMKTYRNKELRDKGHRLDYRWVHEKREGKGVAWSAYFKLKTPDRPHRVQIYAQWKENPGTHQSYGVTHGLMNLKTS